ncbi:MAG: hypothetical protein BroJett021_26840 [Chloroflexota bacterium]|jgi:hypothetical protein|nr:hypothetical protein [Caldilinea sp.]GIK73696.1 MAG: hypothetical protein BroJett021_26840 [Chloroflexota bacterium]
MFPHNEYVLVENQRMRQQEMLQEATVERILRQRQAASVSPLDAGLAAIGRMMVQAGRRLEQRGDMELHSV